MIAYKRFFLQQNDTEKVSTAPPLLFIYLNSWYNFTIKIFIFSKSLYGHMFTM